MMLKRLRRWDRVQIGSNGVHHNTLFRFCTALRGRNEGGDNCSEGAWCCEKYESLDT